MKRDYLLKLIVIVAFALMLCAIGGSYALADEFTTTAKSAIVMERSSNRVLYSKNENAHLPMASTTKIVTAYTVINHCNLDDMVTIPREACGVEGSSIYLREGEHLTVRELLYGLMLRSGNDAAVALAIHTSGSISQFAELMNETARSLGCNDSHFVNPHGLHDDEHYTSARDLAVITCNALENADFQQIVSTKTFRIANEGYEYDRVLVNKNKLLSNFENADGVKTGYTKKAGRCFVGSATRNGMQVVVVVLNCGPMFEETSSMLDEAFENYTLQTIVPLNKVCGSYGQTDKRNYYVCPERVQYPVRASEELSVSVELSSDVQQISVYLNGQLLCVKQLVPVR